MRCFLDSNDEVTSICDARFIVIQSKCGIGALSSTKCNSLKDIPRVVAGIGIVYWEYNSPQPIRSDLIFVRKKKLKTSLPPLDSPNQTHFARCWVHCPAILPVITRYHPPIRPAHLRRNPLVMKELPALCILNQSELIKLPSVHPLLLNMMN